MGRVDVNALDAMGKLQIVLIQRGNHNFKKHGLKMLEEMGHINVNALDARGKLQSILMLNGGHHFKKMLRRN